jgi:hypothetical protein
LRQRFACAIDVEVEHRTGTRKDLRTRGKMDVRNTY